MAHTDEIHHSRARQRTEQEEQTVTLAQFRRAFHQMIDSYTTYHHTPTLGGGHTWDGGSNTTPPTNS